MLNLADDENRPVQFDGNFFAEFQPELDYAFFDKRRVKAFEIFFGQVTSRKFRRFAVEFRRSVMRFFDEGFVNVIDRVNADFLDVFVSETRDFRRRRRDESEHRRRRSEMHDRTENRQVRLFRGGNRPD